MLDLGSRGFVTSTLSTALSPQPVVFCFYEAVSPIEQAGLTYYVAENDLVYRSCLYLPVLELQIHLQSFAELIGSVCVLRPKA